MFTHSQSAYCIMQTVHNDGPQHQCVRIVLYPPQNVPLICKKRQALESLSLFVMVKILCFAGCPAFCGE